jgi:hypothetical protein
MFADRLFSGLAAVFAEDTADQAGDIPVPRTSTLAFLFPTLLTCLSVIRGMERSLSSIQCQAPRESINLSRLFFLLFRPSIYAYPPSPSLYPWIFFYLSYIPSIIFLFVHCALLFYVLGTLSFSYMLHVWHLLYTIEYTRCRAVCFIVW